MPGFQTSKGRVAPETLTPLRLQGLPVPVPASSIASRTAPLTADRERRLVPRLPAPQEIEAAEEYPRTAPETLDSDDLTLEIAALKSRLATIEAWIEEQLTSHRLNGGWRNRDYVDAAGR